MVLHSDLGFGLLVGSAFPYFPPLICCQAMVAAVAGLLMGLLMAMVVPMPGHEEDSLFSQMSMF